MNKLRSRLVFFFIIVILIVSGLYARLVQLHIVDASKLSEEAKAQHVRKFILPAKRGQIIDNEGAIFALSTEVYTVYGIVNDILPNYSSAEPEEQKQMSQNLREYLESISTVIDLDVDRAFVQFYDSDNIVVKLADNINKPEIELLESLIKNTGIPGISIDEKAKRFYPYHEVASHIIGLTNVESNGFLGLEMYYNSELSGVDGYELLTTDAMGKPLPYGFSKTVPAKDGSNLYISINNMIQFFSEEAVRDACLSTESKSASAVVIDMQTNSVLAMATYPTFSLNEPNNHSDFYSYEEWEKLTPEEKTEYLYRYVWNNRIISNTYEPGSTMKTIIAAIAIEEGLININSQFTCNGFTEISGEKLKCNVYPMGHGTQDLSAAFCNSCNVAFMQIVDMIGKDKLYSYLDKLNLLGASGVDLPSEASTIFIEKEELRPIELKTMGYGHAFSVNMLNYANAISNIVYDGHIRKPKICQEVEIEKGKTVVSQDLDVNRVFSDSTVAVIRDLLEDSANKPGSPFNIENVRLGGKSGTSVKVVDGVYDMDTVIASYIGFAPIDDPKYCVYVVIDEPAIAEYGMKVASPVVKKIVEDMFRYNSFFVPSEVQSKVIVPDLKGYTLEEVERIVSGLDLKVSTNPINVENKDRIVINQYPFEGTEVDAGFSIIINIGDE